MTSRRFISNISRQLAAAALIAGGLSSASAALPTVKARLDSASILMGRMTTLRLQVVEDEGAKGTFPLLQPNDRGYAGVCGDSVELRTSIQRDTTRLGSGRIQVDWQVPVQSFDSGAYRLPELAYVVGRDTVRTNRLSLKVVPVKATAEDQIAGLARPADPAGKSFWDFLPDWLVDYWWIGLIAVMAALICFEEAIRRKPGVRIPGLAPKKEPDPWEEAVSGLENLKAQKLWEQGQEKEYFTRLTDILRIYLQKRFGINAMEMTSRQIMMTLAADTELREKRGMVRQILDMADFVKFAKVRPLPDDNIAAWNNAMAFVRDTKPQPVSAPAGGADAASSVMAKDGEGKKGGEA